MRTVASQKDKSADLFALTARSKNCPSSNREPASSAQLLQVQKQKMAEITIGRADRTVRRQTAAACPVSPWKKFESARVCLDAADGAASEPCESTFHNIQIQPIQQPSAEDFGDEAA